LERLDEARGKLAPPERRRASPRRSETEEDLMAYRIYFRDAAGICGRFDFDADGDWAAMVSAELLADACSDKCTGFELWQDTRQLCDRRTLPPLPAVTLSELTERRQATVIETEEAIKDSAFAIAGSQ
jgi:hypothetical protein